MFLLLDVDSAIVPFFASMALPCFSWGLSVSVVMPSTWGRGCYSPRWVSCRQKILQWYSLQSFAPSCRQPFYIQRYHSQCGLWLRALTSLPAPGWGSSDICIIFWLGSEVFGRKPKCHLGFTWRGHDVNASTLIPKVRRASTEDHRTHDACTHAYIL